jgi:CheY-like chemotaxis protein
MAARFQAPIERGFFRVMASKCALIVDDSRTARQALGEMLVANHLRVETAASAEEALDYLSRSRPDVIFMDHMMPGMDGLQAVRAIKTNPATATIPIMMYTSQEGELYVGQARALGAVGVLPKQIKPVEVSEVLRSLHLVEAASSNDVAPDPPPFAERRRDPARDVGTALNMRDWSDLHRWLQEMFEHHGQEIRADLEAAVARVLREQAVPLRDAGTATGAAPAGRGPLTTLLIVALAGLAGLFLWLHLDTQEKWRAAVTQNASLMATLTSRRTAASAAATDTARQIDAQRVEISDRFNDFVTALEWGVNQSATYPAGDEPFGSQRLETLRGLLERLAALGFTGSVRLDSHVGDFCYAAGPEESLVVAPEDLPAERCERIGLPMDEARSASARESVAFASFLTSRASDPAIRIEIAPHGNTMPAVPYPPGPQGLTAGEWNQVARQNNRVTVTLLPDALP